MTTPPWTPYRCHYVACDNDATSGGFCGVHETYVHGSDRDLETEPDGGDW